jgi:hypothetical protein
MDNPEPSMSSSADRDVSLRLPFPMQPLREHPPLDNETMVKQMEALLAAANLGPAFEAMRLTTKNKARFRM